MPTQVNKILRGIGDQTDAYINGYGAFFKGNVENPYNLTHGEGQEYDEWERAWEDAQTVSEWLEK